MNATKVIWPDDDRILITVVVKANGIPILAGYWGLIQENDYTGLLRELQKIRHLFSQQGLYLMLAEAFDVLEPLRGNTTKLVWELKLLDFQTSDKLVRGVN